MNSQRRFRPEVVRGLLGLIILVSAGLSWLSLTTGHNWGDDFATYIMQAQGIAGGNPTEALADNRFAMENSTRLVGPGSAPWGVPLLLAPIYAAFGLDMLALKGLNVACYALFLVLLAFALSRPASTAIRLGLVCVFAFNPFLITFMDQILSDIPFLFFSTLGVILIGRVALREKPMISKPVDHVLLGLAIAFSFFVRSNGVLLLVTLAFAQMIKAIRYHDSAIRFAPTTLFNKARELIIALFRHRRPSAAVPLLPYIAFLIAVVLWQSVFPEENVHLASRLHVSPATITKNLVYYAQLTSDFFSGVPYGHVFYWVSVPFMIVGVARTIRDKYHLPIYVALTLLLYIVAPIQQGLRYLFPILPFYAFFVLIGLEYVASRSWARPRICGPVTIVAVLFVVTFFARTSVGSAGDNLRKHRELDYGPMTSFAQQMFSFIREETEPTDIVAFFKPRAMRLFTGRRSIVVHELSALNRSDYTCLYKNAGDYQLPLDGMEKLVFEGRLKVVWVRNPCMCLRIVK